MLTRRLSISSSTRCSPSKDVLSTDLPSENKELFVLVNEFVKQYELEIAERTRVPKGHYTQKTLEQIFRHPRLDQTALSELNPEILGRIILIYATTFSPSEPRDQKTLTQIQANCHKIATFIFHNTLPIEAFKLSPIDRYAISTLSEVTQISPDLLLSLSSLSPHKRDPLSRVASPHPTPSSSSSSIPRSLSSRSMVSCSTIEMSPDDEPPDIKTALLNCSEKTISWFKGHPANPLFYTLALQMIPSIDGVRPTQHDFINFYPWCVNPAKLFKILLSAFNADLGHEKSKQIHSTIIACLNTWITSHEHTSELQDEKVFKSLQSTLYSMTFSDPQLNDQLVYLQEFVKNNLHASPPPSFISMIEHSHFLTALQSKTPNEFQTQAENIAKELKNAFCHLLLQTPSSAFLTYSGKVEENSQLARTAMANQQLSNVLANLLYNKELSFEETRKYFESFVIVANQSIQLDDYNTAYIIYSRLRTIRRESTYVNKLKSEQRIQYQYLTTLYSTDANWSCLREQYQSKAGSSILFIPVIELALRDLSMLKEVPSLIAIKGTKKADGIEYLEEFESYNPDKHLSFGKIATPFLYLNQSLRFQSIEVSQSLIDFLSSNNSFFGEKGDENTGHPICSSSTDSSGSTPPSSSEELF